MLRWAWEADTTDVEGGTRGRVGWRELERQEEARLASARNEEETTALHERIEAHAYMQVDGPATATRSRR